MGNCSVSALSTKETLCAGTLVGLTLAAAVSAIVLHRLSLFDKGVTGKLKGWHIVVGGSSLIVLADIYGVNKLYKKEPAKAAPAAQIVEVKTATPLGEEESKVAEEDSQEPSEPVYYLTGTNSTTLFGMQEVVDKGITKVPALVPTGTLMQHNIVPLYGELHPKMGIAEEIGKNLQGISTVIAEYAYTAKRYAENKKFNININKEVEFINRYGHHDFKNILRLRIAILRLWHLKDQLDNVKEIEEEITEIISQLKGDDQQQIQDAFAIFTSDLPKARKDLVKEESYPIVWGIKARGNEKQKIDDIKYAGGIAGEATLEGSLCLEEDIHVVYTPKMRIPQLRAWLDTHQGNSVQLFPLKSLDNLMNLSVQESTKDFMDKCIPD